MLFREELEPEFWMGTEPPVLEHIDIAENFKNGNRIVPLYHRNCPSCRKLVRIYNRMARNIDINNEVRHAALVEIPPYCQSYIDRESPCLCSRLNDSKECFVKIPVTVLFVNGRLCGTWRKAPNSEGIMKKVTAPDKNDYWWWVS